MIPARRGETEEETELRREENKFRLKKNLSRSELRISLIMIVQQRMPDYAIEWMKRNHPEYLTEGRLNDFCIAVPQALIVDEGLSVRAKRLYFSEKRAKFRKIVIEDKITLGSQCQQMKDLIAFAPLMNVVYENEDIVYDMMEKLSGDLAQIRADFYNATTEFERLSAGLNGQALDNMRERVLGQFPNDIISFESFVRTRSIFKRDVSVFSKKELGRLRKLLRESNCSVDESENEIEVVKEDEITGIKTNGIICDLCEMEGHRMRDCTKLELAKELIKVAK